MTGFRSALAVALLAAGTVAWAAVPLSGAPAEGGPILIAAIGFAGLSVLRLAAELVAGRPREGPREAEFYVPPLVDLWRKAVSAVRSLPWAQCMIIAVLGLEALHPARPWHTALLGFVLLGYLFALHLAESGARPTALRRQLPLAAAGVGLAGLSAGAAVLPAASAGSGWLSVVAAIAALVAAAMALPI